MRGDTHYKNGFSREASLKKYLDRLYKLDSGVQLVSGYEGGNKRCLHRCICGTEWTAFPSAVLRGGMCVNCGISKSTISKRKGDDEHRRDLLKAGLTFQPTEEYKTRSTPIRYRCEKGHVFTKAPGNVLKMSQCGDCKREEELQDRLHFYTSYLEDTDYEMLGEFLGNTKKVLHKCSEGHRWMGVPKRIMKGVGCPSCSNKGFDQSGSAFLYYLKINKSGKDWYKLGVTNSSLERRYSQSFVNDAKVLMKLKFSSGAKCIEVEKILKKKYAHMADCDDKSIMGYFAGTTELFSQDVLGLDFNGAC